MKYIISVFLVFLVSCGRVDTQAKNLFDSRQTYDQVIEIKFTPEPYNGTNYAVIMSKDNFVVEISKILDQVLVFNPDSRIKDCEIGFAVPDGFEVEKFGNQETCAILFLDWETARNSDYLSELMQNPMLVGITTDVVGPEYPLIFIIENTFDYNYYVRVMLHEGFHMERIRGRQNILSNNEEEALAYEIQFEVLEKQYFDLSSPESYRVPGLSETSFEALKFEHLLYQNYKEGKLLEFLNLINYN